MFLSLCQNVFEPTTFFKFIFCAYIKYKKTVGIDKASFDFGKKS